ncbi:unnamed protein product [Gongylonema pulchrum]|uniref:Ion_trans_2 domain-containing protein n=1 Tax=Gongylonema pulchrum TaxID=637853 RepID=A0A183EFU1_9BILA|nr:unnamed protein product [Gongylonema pulchrum]
MSVVCRQHNPSISSIYTSFPIIYTVHITCEPLVKYMYAEVLPAPMAGWKKYARIILPHVGLIILSLLYIIGGAFAFYHLERPNEIAVRRESLKEVYAQRKLMLEELWAVLNDDSVSDGMFGKKE